MIGYFRDRIRVLFTLKNNNPGVDFDIKEINLDQLTLDIFTDIEKVIDKRMAEHGYPESVAPWEIGVPVSIQIGNNLKQLFTKRNKNKFKLLQMLNKTTKEELEFVAKELGIEVEENPQIGMSIRSSTCEL